MNTMGKILAGLNLAFSLITGYLIIMVFITRTNWKEGYERLSGDLTKAQTAYDTTKTQLEEKVAEKGKEVDATKADLKLMQQKYVDAEAIQRESEKKMHDAVQAKNQSDIIISKLTAERAALLVEVKSLDDRLAERQAKVLELEQKTREYQAKAIKFEIDYMSAQDRNEKLVNRLTDVTKELEHLRGEKAEQSATLQRNPPPEDVKGKVMTTDQQSGYVTINLGSDNGITKGNTLEVYRRQPRPQYVGVLRILEVRPHEAVGRLVQRSASIQPGDEVASDILGRR